MRNLNFNIYQLSSEIIKGCLCVLLLCVFISCKESKRTQVRLEHVDTVFLHHDLRAYGSWRNSQLIQTDSMTLFVGLEIRNDRSIFIHKWPEGNLLKIITPEKEGSNGVGNIHGMYFVNEDSIFVLDSYQYKLRMINSNGKLIRTYKLLEDTEDTALPLTFDQSPILKLDNLIIIPSSSDNNPFDDHYGKKLNAIKLNLNTGKFEYIAGFSSIYTSGEGFWGGPDHELISICKLSDGRLITSYPVDPFIYQLGIKEGDLMNPITAKSALLGEMKPMSHTKDFVKYTKYQLTTNKYYSIRYDQFQNLTYRTLEVAFEKEDVSEAEISNMAWDLSDKVGARGLLIFDEDLNKLGEVVLPEGLGVSNMVIAPTGVYFNQFKMSNDEISVYVGFKVVID